MREIKKTLQNTKEKDGPKKSHTEIGMSDSWYIGKCVGTQMQRDRDIERPRPNDREGVVHLDGNLQQK